MFILLLPPVAPPEPAIGATGPRVDLTPGLRVSAVVLQPAQDGRSMLHLAGRDVASHQPLPFAPGTRLQVEVVEGGSSPTVRVLDPHGSLRTEPVSARTYGLAAAVMAAQMLPEWQTSLAALARWLPLLVARGVLPAGTAAALKGQLMPSATSGTPGLHAADAATLAGVLAGHLPGAGLLLEQRMAQALRRDAAALPAAFKDLRSQLAALGAVLEQDTSGEYGEATSAVDRVQQALLGEQARAAAHFARDGAIDVRVPLQRDGCDLHLRLRVEPDPAQTSDESDAAQRVVRVDVTLPPLGRLRVVIGWSPQHVRAEVVTESAEAAEAIEQGLPELTGALNDAGFTDVLSRVTVDPGRLYLDDSLPDLPSEGSIVSADA